jgi:SOS-response transcriptional repressor LexA
MFNEGLDIPAVDRVIMLRPTESTIIFMQQLGRGLRAAEGKSRLLVIDFVGNHRIFAQRLIHLLSLGGVYGGWDSLKNWLKGGAPELPAGCLLDVELEAREMLKEFIPKGARAGIEGYRAIRDELGRRPSASQLLGRGYLPRVVSSAAGDWFAFVESEGDLGDDEKHVVAKFRQWLKTVETTNLNKSYKMVVLRVLMDHGQLFTPVHLPTFARQCRSFLQAHSILKRDLEGDRHAIDHATADDDSWAAWWIEWPITRWLNVQNGARWFRRDGDVFFFKHNCPMQLQAALESLTEELVDWRLAAYSRSRQLVAGDSDEMEFEAKVSHSGGRPILFLPERTQYLGRPVGPTEVILPDGARWEFKFVKVACNVASPMRADKNQLADLLREWFGPDAGLPGTDFKVHFARRDGQWHARPVGVRVEALVASSLAEQASTLKIEPYVEKAVQFTTHLPVYDLRIAAGHWGPDSVPEPVGWIRILNRRLSPGMFAAQVSGRSMEPEIRDGDWCLFRPCPAGSRNNRRLLLQVNTHLDPEDGGRYTVKRYQSTKKFDENGWRHETIELQPLNPDYSTIHVSAEDAQDIRVIGEFVSVISERQ